MVTALSVSFAGLGVVVMVVAIVALLAFLALLLFARSMAKRLGLEGLNRPGKSGALERELTALGIKLSHSRPYHPQTCGKVERLHQTLKNWLARQPAASTITELQTQLDTFAEYYNHQRPHRALQRQTPATAWAARPKAVPARQGIHISEHFRVRKDRVDSDGKLTLRHNSRLHHIGIGRDHAGTRVLLLIHELNIRVITQDTGQLIRALTLDPSRDYQPTGKDRYTRWRTSPPKV